MRDVGTLTARNWAEGGSGGVPGPWWVDAGREVLLQWGCRQHAGTALGDWAPSLWSSRLCGRHPFPRTDCGRGPGLSGARRRLELE